MGKVKASDVVAVPDGIVVLKYCVLQVEHQGPVIEAAKPLREIAEFVIFDLAEVVMIEMEEPLLDVLQMNGPLGDLQLPVNLLDQMAVEMILLPQDVELVALVLQLALVAILDELKLLELLPGLGKVVFVMVIDGLDILLGLGFDDVVDVISLDLNLLVVVILRLDVSSAVDVVNIFASLAALKDSNIKLAGPSGYSADSDWVGIGSRSCGGLSDKTDGQGKEGASWLGEQHYAQQ